MDYSTIVLFSLSVFPAAGLGLARIKNMDPEFYPFICYLCAGSVNEIITVLRSGPTYTTAVNNNCHVLAEALFIIWQFKKWHLFGANKYLYASLFSLLTVTWLFEYHSLATLQHIGPTFRVVAAFIIVMMSVLHNNKIIFLWRRKLIINPAFLTGTAFITWFTFKILIVIFWGYTNGAGPTLSASLFKLHTRINLFINLIYFGSVLCIPLKKCYIDIY